jgi:hypothetical protein
MLKKLRTFLISLLLVPVLTLNANAFTTDADPAAFNPPQQSMCWVYFAHTWWLLPC